MDRKTFFDALRTSGLFARLTQAQVDGIEGLLDAFVTHGDGKADTLAYGLATAYIETDRRMVPVREGLGKTDAESRARVLALGRKRGPGSPPSIYGQSTPPHGHAYYGRGHVQITWLKNYAASSKDAGVDLVRDPDAMLDPVISARVLWLGLLDGRWNGLRHGLRHYLDVGDVVGARRTVNGSDKASEIAGYHYKFLAAIRAAGGVPTAPRAPDVPSPAPIAKRGGLLDLLLSLLKGFSK